MVDWNRTRFEVLYYLVVDEEKNQIGISFLFFFYISNNIYKSNKGIM